ncbi:MAG: choice-of-anchor A family protein [bacterium]|nr:choice-of-anchor A family protein [bacterium]
MVLPKSSRVRLAAALLVPVLALTLATPARADVAAALAAMAHYDLITLEDLSTSSEVEGRTWVGGSIVSGTSANFAIHLAVPPNDDTLVVVGQIVAGNPLQLQSGSARVGGSTNGRTINFNGGGALVPDPSLSDAQMTADLQGATATIGAMPANNAVTLPGDQPGPARFQVTTTDACGTAVFTVAASALFGNSKVQQIELTPGSAQTIVINVTGTTVDWQFGNLVSAFTQATWRSRVLWNFPQATSINLNARNLMGAILAPYAAVTTQANIDGSTAVRALTTSSEIHQPEFTGNLACLPTTTTTLPTTTTTLATTTTTTSTSTTTLPTTTTTLATTTTTTSTSSTTTTVDPTTTTSTSTTTTSSTTTTTVPDQACGCAAAFRVAYESKINNDASVSGGVTVNMPRGRINTGRNVRFADGSVLVADRVSLGHAVDAFSVLANTLSIGQNGVVRGATGPAPALPLAEPFCEIPTFTCGGDEIRVLPGTTVGPLAPGRYGSVRILNGGTLLLAPGTYEFCSVTMGRGARLATDGVTTLNVVSKLTVGSGSRLTPADPQGPMPVINLAGHSGRVSQGAVLRAALNAPHAKLTFGRDSTLLGCFCASRQKSDKHITLACVL